MDNLAANKNHIPFQTWVNHGHGWPTTSTQGLGINPHTDSQHLGLNLSSDQQLLYNHPLQASNQSCTNNNTNSHNTAPHMSNLNLPNSAVLGASHLMSFAQQTPHTSSMWVGSNQGKTVSSLSLPQPNQGPQPCSSQHFSPLPANNAYKTFPAQALAEQDQSLNLPSCRMSANLSQATFGGRSRESTGVDESSHSYDSSTSQEPPQWVHSSQSNEAAGESTPVVPVDKEPSQKPVGKKKRTLILNLRTQLLNQLDNVNKLLESLAPDAGNDGQAPNKALQAEASDAQEEEESISDEPDKSMSPAESEEMQESCIESGDDNDSDYTPQNDDSLSDCPSENTINSEDCHIDSSPKSPTNETPTTQKIKEEEETEEEEEEEEEENPLFKEKNASPSKRTQKTKQKKHFKTMVESKPKKKEGHFYKRNYCVFCSKPVIKMSRHLTNSHSYKAEVAIAFQYPANSKERKNIWTKLTNQGNFAHNKAVLKTGKGQLAVRVRPRKTSESINFVPCTHCLGLYKKRSLLRHMKVCPFKAKTEDKPMGKRPRVISRCALLAKGCDDLSEGMKDILGGMIYNEVTEAIVDDPVIVQFGEHMLNETGVNVKRQEYLRQNLRYIARLVLEAQKSTPMQSLQDFFDPSNFRHVVSAVKVIAGYDPEKKTYTLPSLAYKLGFNLKKICGIIEQNAIKSGDTKVQESCKTFLLLYNKKWRRLISSQALTGMRKMQRKNLKIVPFVEDVKCLYFHMETVYLLAEKKLRENICAENYADLAKVVLSQTIAFNRRKSSEVASIQIKAFMLRKKSDVLDDMDITVSNLERTLCGFFSRVDIRGSSGRMVPVLLKPSCESAMELLINVREACGVHSDNPFVFAQTYGLSSFHGSRCFHKYVQECGAKNPATLTLFKLRKHFSTMLQLIHLDENEARQIFGPNNQIQALLQNNMCENTNAELQDSHPTKTKQIWKESEINAVEKHLMQFITEQKLPLKDDCVRCLEAEPHTLRKRSWKDVKNYVRNRITTLQRQSGISKDSSKTSNRPRQKEPQQRSVRSQPSNTQAATEHHSVVFTSSSEPGTLDQQQSHGVTSYTKTARSKKAKEKGLQHKPKPKWSEAEVCAVEKHLMRLIEEHRLPQKDDCVRCLEAEPHALRNRSWKGVKDYVRNRITTLQRQSGSCKSSSKSSNRHKQKEPRQSLVRSQPDRQEAVSEKHSMAPCSSFEPAHVNEQVHEETSSNKTAPSKSGKSRENVSHPKTKHKWDEAEVSAVERHMMRFIEKHKLPQKDDCVLCLDAEPHALRNRSWKGVKDYVRNRITTAQRQSRCSRNSSKISKRPRKEKPQQSSGHYQQL